MNALKNRLFRNWAKNIQFTARHYLQPETEQQLTDIIRTNASIRVVGTGHSWSSVCQTTETLINLDKLNKIISINKTEKTVRVQAGIKLFQLNELLDKEGLALINLGSIAQQSLAGAISTGTHGSGIHFQCLASQVLEFSMILADGEKITVRKGDDLFDAAVISLGCLGVISEMTLQVTDAFNLHDKTFTRNFGEVTDDLHHYLYTTDHFKLWWMPPAEKAVVYTYQRTQEKRNDSRFRQLMNDKILSVLGYRLLVKIGNLKWKWRRPINTFLTAQMDGPLDRIEKSYKVFNVPEPPLHRETEWAFDVRDAKALLTEYRQLFTDTSFTFNFIQEIRFTKGDNFWLSECYGRDTIWIGAYNHEDSQWNEILKTFETFALKHKGRPHWGKEFNVRKHELNSAYPKYADFMALRKQMDPQGKFSNPLMEELFG
jgi:FAD/FMN-containing dehydrogenase